MSINDCHRENDRSKETRKDQFEVKDLKYMHTQRHLATSLVVYFFFQS